jgi:hypothetical protein
MAAQYYDRYEPFKVNGKVNVIPGITLPRNSTDKLVLYVKGQSRLDIISQLYYNNPYHGYIIMMANPQFGGLEFNIKDREVIVVPYPFESAIQRYINEVKKYKLLYGE